MDTIAKPWMEPGLPPLPKLDDSEWMQVRIYQGMTPYQRWEQAAGLREMAGQLRKSALKKAHPEWSEPELEAAVREFLGSAGT